MLRKLREVGAEAFAREQKVAILRTGEHFGTPFQQGSEVRIEQTLTAADKKQRLERADRLLRVRS
jgi:hypothetical protein